MMTAVTKCRCGQAIPLALRSEPAAHCPRCGVLVGEVDPELLGSPDQALPDIQDLLAERLDSTAHKPMLRSRAWGKRRYWPNLGPGLNLSLRIGTVGLGLALLVYGVYWVFQRTSLPTPSPKRIATELDGYRIFPPHGFAEMPPPETNSSYVQVGLPPGADRTSLRQWYWRGDSGAEFFVRIYRFRGFRAKREVHILKSAQRFPPYLVKEHVYILPGADVTHVKMDSILFARASYDLNTHEWPVDPPAQGRFQVIYVGFDEQTCIEMICSSDESFSSETFVELERAARSLEKDSIF